MDKMHRSIEYDLRIILESKSREFSKFGKVANLSQDENTHEGKPSSQENRKEAWLGCAIGVSIVFRGPSSG